MTQVALIVAVARNGTIGHGNALLWHLPEDARYFRAQTMGCPVIMGRKTWDSLPARFRPLPGRQNIVVTRQPGWAAAGATVAHSLDQALLAAGDAARVFVIGGAALYAAALPRVDELLLTELHADFDGDTRFPPWDRNAFVEQHREVHHAAAPNDFDFSFVRYRRR
ncbi:dihydrofolate reductase [Aquabacterium sp.]|uniref:dihydrofolate reductase n=1 Tax=Aquabacterium sp. TaxID=1872578 RepID=UPI002CFE653A|nr:dihydrofolate reductase [Aquabacterium sp.]HSW08656.1 dihydrofolate reductase [Aquabacterium sp.]